MKNSFSANPDLQNEDCEWATLPMLIMYPILVWLYARLARREEADMRAEFGPAYDDYRARTGMFLPRLQAINEGVSIGN